LKTKSLLPSLYPPGQRPLWVGDKREEFPLFGKEGLGEIFTTICLFNYGLLSNRGNKKMMMCISMRKIDLTK
jgi:hypothetical protein